jgi:hypothetical protein
MILYFLFKNNSKPIKKKRNKKINNCVFKGQNIISLFRMRPPAPQHVGSLFLKLMKNLRECMCG